MKLPVDAELLSTLDEKFVVHDIAFEAMHAAAVLVVDASDGRLPDGSIDRGLFERFALSFVAQIPHTKRRLVRMPLGLTTPVWVPVRSFDLADHLVFHPDTLTLDRASDDVLSGRGLPLMRLSKPMWQLVVVGLADGRVAVVVRFHHVVGDGIYNLTMLDAVLRPAPGAHPIDPPAEGSPYPPLGRRPLHAFHALVVVGARWYRQRGSVGAAWKEYWRKPFAKRLRRSGGRVIRPLKNRVAARRRDTYLPPRHSRFATLDLRAVEFVATRLGCSLNDLLVAATLVASAPSAVGDDVALLVPISRRTVADVAVRNHISIARIAVPRGLTLDAMVPLVAEQVRHAAQHGAPAIAPGATWLGYATYIPWSDAPKYVGPAAVASFVAWPIGDPRDELACLMTRYADTVTVSLTMHRDVDVDARLDGIVAAIGARAVVRS